jgi:hypothetical protein
MSHAPMNLNFKFDRRAVNIFCPKGLCSNKSNARKLRGHIGGRWGYFRLTDMARQARCMRDRLIFGIPTAATVAL